MNSEIQKYNNGQSAAGKQLCDLIAKTIDGVLAQSESKIWHSHPVWFLNGNPIVGYSKQKAGWRLMFWSGASFEEARLNVLGKKFKDASIFFNSVEEINLSDLKRWLKKSVKIQWDYKNIVVRRGRLEPLSNAESKPMKDSTSTDQRIAKMTFASVYPHYVTKVEKKGRTIEELHQVIQWLTGYSVKKLQQLIKNQVTFEEFFEKAKLNPNAHLITGTICGYKVENIENKLTREVRYLDKLVDELAKGRKMEKILRE